MINFKGISNDDDNIFGGAWFRDIAESMMGGLLVKVIVYWNGADVLEGANHVCGLYFWQAAVT